MIYIDVDLFGLGERFSSSKFISMSAINPHNIIGSIIIVGVDGRNKGANGGELGIAYINIYINQF